MTSAITTRIRFMCALSAISAAAAPAAVAQVKPPPARTTAAAPKPGSEQAAVKAPAQGAPSAAAAPGKAPQSAPPGPPPFVRPNRPLAAITALAYSSDGKRLAVGTFGEVVVFDTTTWQQTAVFRQVADAVRTLAFAPDNQTIAVGSGLPGRSGQTALWDCSGAGKARPFPDQYDAVESVAFEKSGKGLLIGADDNKVRYVPDTGSGGGTVLDSHNGRVQAVAFSPKERTIFVTAAMDRIAKVWDQKTVKNVINFDQSEGGLTGIAFLNNGDQFVGSSLDGRLYWWGVGYDQKKDAYNGYHFRTVGAHNGGVYTLSRSADGNRIITGGADHAICIWDINNGGQVRAFKETTTQPVYAAALSPDGKIAAAGGRDGLVYVLDVTADKLLATLVPPPVSPGAAAPSAPPARHARRR